MKIAAAVEAAERLVRLNKHLHGLQGGQVLPHRLRRPLQHLHRQAKSQRRREQVAQRAWSEQFNMRSHFAAGSRAGLTVGRSGQRVAVGKSHQDCGG